MKEAVGILDGWRCPACGKRVKCPDGLKVVKEGSAIGQCSFCKEPLHFSKVHFSKETPEEAHARITEDTKKYETLFGDSYKINEKVEEELHPFIKDDRDVVIEARLAIVNFLNKPLLLKWFQKYAIEKDLYLSEVIISFAALGVKEWHRVRGLIK